MNHQVFERYGQADACVYRGQRTVHDLLRNVREGCIALDDPAGHQTVFGDRRSNLSVRIRVHRSEFYHRILSDGALGVGESYVDGWWSVDEERLTDLFRIAFSNHLETGVRANLLLEGRLFFYRYLSSPRFLRAAVDDIRSHYDLSPALFRAMLDGSMTYSCGYRCHPGDTLAEMQDNKHRLVYQKLRLDEAEHLLDIGCGWGGMLLHAARRNPALRATGITLSKDQFESAAKKIAEEGFSDRVRVVMCDYRKIEGRYDRVSSIGMFEHVGRESYPEFFRQITRCLVPGGLGLLHTIGLEEETGRPQDPWIAKYIFPGSRLPRLEEIASQMRRAKLTIGHVENLRPHYAVTLRKWRENFVKNWPALESSGFDGKFYRLWDYYLQLCEACFIDSTLQLYQVLFCSGHRWSFPMRFDYTVLPPDRARDGAVFNPQETS